MNKNIVGFACLLASLALVATGCSSVQVGSKDADTNQGIPDSLNVALMQDAWTLNQEYDCYALEGIVYVENYEDAVKQSMNIYVPSAYMHQDGSLDKDAVINGYTAETAPMLYIIGVGGYAEADPSSLSSKTAVYLQQGYVVVSPGARGRQTKSQDGTSYIGKSPAALIDLKAGIRFLKANDPFLAGSSEKIITIGTSAGGALSSLLAATGNSSDYLQYLQEAGAIMSVGDAVYASQIYCPITDLDHADSAYEWMFQGTTNENGSQLSPFEQALSSALVPTYVDYVNSLGLKDPSTGEPLVLENDGHGGSFSAYMLQKLEESAAKYLSGIETGTIDTEYSVSDYLQGKAEGIPTGSGASAKGDGFPLGEIPDFIKNAGPQGEAMGAHPGFGGMMQNSVDVGTLDKTSWLSWDGENARITSLQAVLDNYIARKKGCLAFDDFSLAQAENQEFGDADTDVMHFDSFIAGALEQVKDEYPQEYATYYDAYSAVDTDEALAKRKFLLNPFSYIISNETDMPKNIRIRVGSQDSDTSFSISMSLALLFSTYTEANVDYQLCWDQGHGDADYAGELVQWIDSICK